MLDCLTWFKQRYCYGGSSQFVWTSVHTLFFSFAFRRHYHYHREHILLQISETAFRFSMGGSRSNDSCFSRDLCLWLTAEFELQLKQRKLGTNFNIFFQNLNFPFPYLIFVIFFTQAKFLENKIYTGKRQFLPIFRQFLPIYTEILPIYTVNCQFTQKIANFSR